MSRTQSGVFGALAQLAASALALLRTRIELATVEFAEARERIKSMAVLAVLGAILALFALLFTSLFVIVCFWEANRVAAVGGVALFYIVVAAVTFLRLRKISREATNPFAASLEELEHDAAALRRRP